MTEPSAEWLIVTQDILDAAMANMELDTKVTNHGGASGLWVGTTASLPSTGTAGVLYVTY